MEKIMQVYSSLDIETVLWLDKISDELFGYSL